MAKVLAVDDQSDMRWLLSRLLREQGFEVDTANDGVQVLSRVQQEAPQVILLDLKMPQLDGLQALGDFLKRYYHTVPQQIILLLF